MLRKLNFKASLLGYRFLIEALKITINDPDAIYNITNNVYTRTARIFSTSLENVERNIRSAIENALNRCDAGVLEEMFGYTMDNRKGKPTNKEFIAMITDTIIIRNKKIE